MDEKLYADLAAATKYYSIQDEFNEKIRDQNDMIKQLKKRDYGDKAFSIPATIVIISLIVFIPALIMTIADTILGVYINEDINLIIMLLFTSIILLIIFAPLTAINMIKCKKEYDAKVRPQIAIHEEYIRSLESNFESFIAENMHILDFLPEIYRNAPAISFMFLVVSNGRADTLKEAMNLYEEQLHRWKLETYARQTAETQEYCARAIDELNSKQAQTNSHLQAIKFMQFVNYISK